MPENRNNKIVGDMGESLVARHLVSKGYSLVERNFSRKCGEIDLIMKKDGIIHFIEVKTISCDFSHETTYPNPADKVDAGKLARFGRVISVYLLERHNGTDANFQVDVATVLLSQKDKRAKIELIENVL